jgi:ribosomal protein S6--L-glutamate ligase
VVQGGRRRVTDEKSKLPDAPLVLGWQEWVALPGLGLPALKAKIDTGAKTSALHAFAIEPPRGGRVRFCVHPVPRRDDIEVWCEARVVDERVVTSSNGERERRLVIATDIEIDGRRWPIEVTLTNRAAMRSRMLIGRQGLGGGLTIVPELQFRQPKLGYRMYPGFSRNKKRRKA